MIKNFFLKQFSKNQIWYLVTIGGFIIGFVLGMLILSDNTSRSALHLATFWVYPAGAAGLGMGICQWGIAFQNRKNGYLWIPVTAIGFVASTGAILTLLLAASTYARGIYDFAYDGLVAKFAPVAPISLLIGPVCQWLIIKSNVINKPFIELAKMIAGWILATSLLFGMFYIFMEADKYIPYPKNPSWIIGLLVLIIINTPSGLTFARTTIYAIHAN